MNSLIPWVGGKAKLLWIIDQLAPAHYTGFVDVFGGSGTVTLNRPRHPGCVQVYNDFTLSVQGATRFFGAEMPSSGVILVAGRQPGCLVCLAGLPFPLPKNSEGLSSEHQLGLARKRMQVGCRPPKMMTKPAPI